MTTLQNLIKRKKQRAVRKVYITRRNFDNTYEISRQRIDNLNNRDRIISYGQGSWEINNEPGQIPSFEITDITLTVNNYDGSFNTESDTKSFWHSEFTYNRHYSKLHIEVAYLDDNGTEVGTDDAFEGLINNVIINPDETATITVLSFLSVLTQYDYSDISLTGTQTVSTIVDAIMNQSKITTSIPFVSAVPDEDVSIDTSQLVGSYWDVIKELALLSNSIPSLNNDVFGFETRDAGASSVYDFKGRNSIGDEDLYEIIEYDDEGRNRVRVFWRNSETGSSLTATTTVTSLLNKYLNAPQDIDLTKLTIESEKQDVLDAFLALWENPKPSIEFESAFTLNIVNPLDKITINHTGQFSQPDNGFIWGNWTWGDGSVWGVYTGGINIFSGQPWMVTRVTKDFDRWKCIIKAERL